MMSERRLYLRKKRKIQVMKQRIILSLTAFTLIITCSFAFTGIMTSAHDTQKSQPVHPIYESIQIESGDSLWSIAETYKPVNMTTRAYMHELIQLNSLSSDKIHIDQYLTVSCYEASSM